MKLIYFFDEKIKPIALRGKRIIHPTDTSDIGKGIRCIRQYDVNIWFYTKGDTTIAFDAGHLNYPNVEKEFQKIGIDPQKIGHLFLTHVDVDHAGGIDRNGKNIFPDAQVYLGKMEELYLQKKHHRFRRSGLRINNCVEIKEGYRLLHDMETIKIGDIHVQALHTPGHTLGHLCYLVDDKILISGDALAINDEGGYSFFDFFTQYPQMNKHSLAQLKEKISDKKLEIICTGHSGYCTDIDRAFRHIDRSAQNSRRRPFDENAPYDLFAKE